MAGTDSSECIKLSLAFVHVDLLYLLYSKTITEHSVDETSPADDLGVPDCPVRVN